MRAKQCWETEGFLTNASLAFLGVTSISPCNQESSVLPSVWHLEKAQLKMADLRTTVSWFRECLFRALSVSPLGFLCCDSALPRGTERPPPPQECCLAPRGLIGRGPGWQGALRELPVPPTAGPLLAHPGLTSCTWE